MAVHYSNTYTWPLLRFININILNKELSSFDNINNFKSSLNLLQYKI